jgi:hypothetical protein
MVFSADDPDQPALVAAFAAHRQLLPASEADAHEVVQMNSGYLRAVASTADRDLLARGAAAGSTARAARAELNGLLARYLEVSSAGIFTAGARG